RDDRRAQAVEVVELLGRDSLGDRHQVAELRELSVGSAYVDRREIGRLAAVLVLQLDDDVVLLALTLEAGDLAPAEQRLQRAPYRFDLHAHGYRLLAVDVDGELRLVELQVRIHVRKPGVGARTRHHLAYHAV